MAEKLGPSPENLKGPEKPTHVEVKRPKVEREKVDHEKESKKQEKSAEVARKSIEKEAVSGKEKAPRSSEKKRQKSPVKGVKKQNYNQTMKRVESQLPAYQRGFSKFIRSEPVDAVSNVAGKTVARPSAMIGAGFVALVGSIILLYFAKTIGFEISNTEFIVFIGLGWVAGLAIELIYKSLKHIAS